MAIQEGTIDALLQDVGEHFDDFTVSRAADGTITRARAVSAINWAQRQVHNYL